MFLLESGVTRYPPSPMRKLLGRPTLHYSRGGFEGSMPIRVGAHTNDLAVAKSEHHGREVGWRTWPSYVEAGEAVNNVYGANSA